MIWRKRIPPTGRRKLNLEESQNKFACQIQVALNRMLTIHCLKMHKRLFGVEAKKLGGDTGYAGTDNRDYCKKNGIHTTLVKRGRPFSEEKKEKELVRKELARVRATAMEDSFGTQKEHYDLRRVKARTKQTEILYIFFGIHTANVVQLADRLEQRAHLVVA